MLEGEPSRTAERVAVERAAHQLLDSPIVLVDPLAIRVISREHAALLREHPERHDRTPISKPTRAIVVVRTRIAEDEIGRAVAAGVTQYVLLGAGLDTFAYRNPHAALRVFEVDEPATQRLKRERLAAAGIEVPPRVTFVSCDFSRQRLMDALVGSGFDIARPAVFAWLGVVMYLERDAVIQTLRDITSLPEGTTVIFDYALPPEAVAWIRRAFYRRALNYLAAHGEPWKSFFDPDSLRLELSRLGFTQVEDLGAAEIDDRFLAHRRDGLRSGSVGRIAIARR